MALLSDLIGTLRSTFRVGLATFSSSGLSAARTITLPDASGTVALLSNIGTELKGLTFTSDTGSTADSDPGAGLFKWNNATQASATVMYFDDSTLDAVSVATFFGGLPATGYLYLQQADDASKWQMWKWSSVTDGTGYRKFAVAYQAGGGSIDDDKTVYCDFKPDANTGGGGGGALVLLEQHTASSSASLDFTSFISSTYDEYVFEVQNLLCATDNVDCEFQVSTDGGSSWVASGLYYGFNFNLFNPTSGVVSGSNANVVKLGTSCRNSNGAVSGRVQLYDPLNSSIDKMFTIQTTFRQTGGGWATFAGGASYASATAINAVRFKMSSGNIASGTIRVYGIAKS